MARTGNRLDGDGSTSIPGRPRGWCGNTLVILPKTSVRGSKGQETSIEMASMMSSPERRDPVERTCFPVATERCCTRYKGLRPSDLEAAVREPATRMATV